MSHPLISLTGITKSYYTAGLETTVLAPLNLEIDRASFVAITGHSGSGKSTLLHILGTIDRPTGGTYLYDGIDLTTASDDMHAAIRRTKIGFVFQHFLLLPTLSIFENCALPLLYGKVPTHERRERIEEALAGVGMYEKRYELPTRLSGGQQQRAAIARALVTHPLMILADEPTGSLDSENGRNVLTILEECVRAKGTTVVMVTHSAEDAARAERIITLKDGVVLFAHNDGIRQPDCFPA